MERARFAIVALLSMTVIALEVLWTRIFSAEYFYTFAFLVLSFAILGLGLGALAVRLSPRLAGPSDAGQVLLLGAAVAVAGPAAVLRLKLVFSELYRNPVMVAKLVLALLILGAPFFFAGIGLARLFRTYHGEMPRLYMADLVGAGIGAGVAVLAMNTVEVPLTAVLGCVPMAVAGLLASGRLRVAHVSVGVLLVLAGIFAWPMVSVPRRELGPVIEQHWDTMGRIKIHGMSEEYRNLNIDNAANSPVYGFDGDLEKARAEDPPFMFKISALLEGRKGFVMASLGAGGGSEALQGLIEEAGEIHAIEVNPAINRMLVDGSLTEFSGKIYQHPSVVVISEDGRTYLRRFRDHFDVIVSSSSNSFAALASGAFAMSENYLFTTEAFIDYLNALAPDGYLAMEHQFYVPRAISEATDALRALGVSQPEKHMAVYELPKRRRQVLLLGKAPLPQHAIDVLMGPLTEEVAEHIRLLYPDGDPESLSARIVVNGWKSEFAQAPYDISPSTDNRPFAAQMGLWRNFSWGKLEKLLPYEVFGFPAARLIIFTVLAVTAVLALPLLLLPRWVGGSRLGTVPWLYFFAIGVAFIAVEVILMQQFTLLIGSSAYSFVVTLVTLLIASGLGSRFSERFADAVPFLLIAGWIVLDLLLFASLVRGLAFLPPAGRALAAMILIFPLGFFMGMPFPKAALRVGERIDWGFAVNGVASVLGSAVIVFVAMVHGFRVALLIGAAFYLLALLLIQARGLWETVEP